MNAVGAYHEGGFDGWEYYLDFTSLYHIEFVQAIISQEKRLYSCGPTRLSSGIFLSGEGARKWSEEVCILLVVLSRFVVQ